MVKKKRDPVIDLARELAAEVRVARPRFEAVYDALMTELKATNAANVHGLKDFKAAVLDDDFVPAANDVMAFSRAFAAAIRGDWWRLLVERGLAELVLDPSARQLLNRLELQRHGPGRARKAERGKGTRTVLEAAVNDAEGFLPVVELTNGLTRTMPKICKLRFAVNGRPHQGTGFLIGPQTVLTASHVIEPLLQEGTNSVRQGSDKQLSVEFDCLDHGRQGRPAQPATVYSVVPQWLEEHSPCPHSERPTAEGIKVNGLNHARPISPQLDFAVIRVKGSPGRDRGVVVLPTEESYLVQDAQMKVLVFQHPEGFPLRVASGEVTQFVGTDEPPLRFRHLANTTRGSSGGLCVDAEFRGVGLHQAAVLDDQDDRVENQAVPTILIGRQIKKGYSVDPTLDPLWRLGDSRVPVLGRQFLQDSIWRLVCGDKRLITVRGVGAQRRGLTFSKHILRSILPPTEGVIIDMTAQEIGSDAVELATLLLNRCGGSLSGGERFPSRARAATTADAWLRDQLLPDLAARLNRAASGKPIWLVVDELHRFDVPEKEACYLLKELMKAAVEAPRLRFLLLGADKFLAGIPESLIERDEPRWPEEDDVSLYLQRYCTHEQITLTAQERRRNVRMVMNAIERNPDQNNRWETAVRYLEDDIQPALRDET